MKTIYFKCTLNSNIIVNASLATEGNVKSLNYIPGSNFMGIVASKIYSDKTLRNKAMDYIHNGKVQYGDAYISDGKNMSYPMPFSTMMDKLHSDFETDKKYHQHFINKEETPKDGERILQLQQKRTGFFNTENTYWKEVEKGFALKSAYDSKKRKSEEGKMFGYDSIQKGQVFVFSVSIDESIDESIICEALIGERKIGKSKSAEYGWVTIEKLDIVKEVETQKENGFALVYAHSNLCFYDANGLPTYQPTAEDLGLKSGTIDWERSQVRTYSYAPWNAKRNSPNTQRNCILKGSVFYIENPQFLDDKHFLQVGEYINEGLGRVIINPTFLFSENQSSVWNQKFNLYKEAQNKKQEYSEGGINDYLKNVRNRKSTELEIAKQVFELVEKEKENRIFRKITRSQWGVIRQLASEYNDFSQLSYILLDNSHGILRKGVAYERYWGLKNDKALKALEKIFTENSKLGTIFIAKLASEYAKIN